MRRLSILFGVLLFMVTSLTAAAQTSTDYYAVLEGQFVGAGDGPQGYITATRAASGDYLIRAYLYDYDRPNIDNIFLVRGTCGVPGEVAGTLTGIRPNLFRRPTIQYWISSWEWNDIIRDTASVVMVLDNVTSGNPMRLCGQLIPRQ